MHDVLCLVECVMMVDVRGEPHIYPKHGFKAASQRLVRAGLFVREPGGEAVRPTAEGIRLAYALQALTASFIGAPGAG